MTPQPLSSSQLQTVLLEAKSKNRLLLTRSKQEICPSEPAIPLQRFIKLEDQRQGFLSESPQRRRPPTNRIQLLLEPVSRKRPREAVVPGPSQPSSQPSPCEDQALRGSNNKRCCTEIQDNQPDEPSSSSITLKTGPHPVGHTDVVNTSSTPTPTVKKDEPSTSPQVKPTPCPSPGINYMELDQKSSKAGGPNEITCCEAQAPAVDNDWFPTCVPSIKLEPIGYWPQIPKVEGDLKQNSEEHQGQEIDANRAGPRHISTNEEMKHSHDKQPEEASENEGVHRIPTPLDFPGWPVFEPYEPFQHHEPHGPSSPPAPAEISNFHLLLEAPFSPVRLFDASSPSRPLWEDDLPSVELVADDHPQATNALFDSDTMDPAHLDQRSVDEALMSKPSGRENPLYRGTRGPDGLYHCPWEKEASCSHKPAKLKCTFE